ncbi:hypothetical protein HA466_0056920 [Hirschfeldia incana]|nr:hypothetical protein HA466_0056920 [Hirschfeldia incana]
MTPNLRSLVAKAYRARQGRNFCSSSSPAPNPIGDKGKELDFMPSLDTVSNIMGLFAAGYAVHFCWDRLRILKIKHDTDKEAEHYEIEIERFLDEMSRSRR